MNGTKTKHLLFAAVIGMAAFAFSSCSESEDVASGGFLNVDPSYVSKGIETEVKSTVIEVPVKCSGKWFAVVDSCDWLSVVDEGSSIHEGNGVVKLKVDENRTQVGRKNTLSIIDFNHNEIDVPVYQTNTYNGEPVSNGSADWFSRVGIGCGANYKYFMQPDASRGSKTFDPTQVKKNNNIFNLKELEIKQRTGDVSLYSNNQLDVAQLKQKLLVNSIGKSQHLDATIEMGCSFGFIEFEAKGHYVSDLEDNSASVNYSVCKEAPVLESQIEVATISSLADEALQEHLNGDKKEQIEDDLTMYSELIQSSTKESEKRKLRQKMIDLYQTDFGGYFSTGFAKAYWTLYSTYMNQEDMYPDEAQREKALQDCLKNLDSKWGPYFISGGEFGGSFNLFATVQKKDLNEDVTFDAEATANIADGFELSGSVEFTSKGTQLYKNSNVVMYVYGGNAASTLSAVTEFLDGDMTDTPQLQQILKDWADSFCQFDEDNDGELVPAHASPISFRLTPIWTLFEDPGLQSLVEDYFMEKYADKGIEDWSEVIKGNIGDLSEFLSKLAGANASSK